MSRDAVLGVSSNRQLPRFARMASLRADVGLIVNNFNLGLRAKKSKSKGRPAKDNDFGFLFLQTGSKKNGASLHFIVCS